MGIIHTILTLAQNLELKVTVEGVEREEHLALFRLLQCHYAQGSFFAEPLIPESSEALLAQSPKW